MRLKKIVIIGMGLIGGSIGKAAIERGLADEVVGVCRRQVSLDRAVKEKALTQGYVNNYEEAVNGADIIFIATPVHTIKEVLDKLADTVKDPGVVVTDVGSTKREISEYAEQYKDRFVFIGGHPLAGSEKAGVEYSTPDLFDGSVCILTPEKYVSEEVINKLSDFWTALDATVGRSDPKDHDYYLAFSSHLPHVVAYALAGVVEEEFPKTMFATGFRDTTRIAASDAVLWSDIFMSNRENILKAIAKYKDTLSGIEDNIRQGDEEALKEKLRDYKKVRDELF